MRSLGSKIACLGLLFTVGCEVDSPIDVAPSPDGERSLSPAQAKGRQVFRFDTYGNEPFWTDTLRLHEVIQAVVDPMTALAVGLKVDAERLPPRFLAGADLTDPATTVELLRRDAVLGLRAKVTGGTIKEIGTTCALCHSIVDNSVAAGIGRRLDGWPNRDLDVGLILSLSPALQDPATQAVLTSWGPGFYDPYWNHDGINDPVVIPPAFGLQGVPLETYTGEGPISYWNAYVAVTQMHGQGTFVEPLLGINIVNTPDLVTPKLPILLAYQLSLETPPPPPGSFDAVAAAAGQAIFSASCAGCHIPPTFTDAPTLHDAAETGVDPLYATRGKTGQYRSTPLRALWQHPPYFHDGSAATLEDVVDHYDAVLGLGLTAAEKADLVEYLKSL